MRDALQGLTRFDEFQKSLGISSSMLARRLTQLVEQGLLEKQAYQQRPVRYAYRATDKGNALLPIIVMLFDWGERYASPNGRHEITLQSRLTGQLLEPVVVDRATGAPVNFETVTVAQGPDIGPLMQQRLDRIQAYWQNEYPLSEYPMSKE